MIPFDGQFAQNTVLPLAIAAYDNTTPPARQAEGTTAFEILADADHPAIQAAQVQLQAGPKQQDSGMKMLQGMLKQPDQHQIATSDAAVRALAANPKPNLHFGWVCLDKPNKQLIVAFRGTQFVHDWFDDFDFIPAPYAAVPGRGTVHRGFQLVYTTIRNNLIGLLDQHAAGCKQLLIRRPQLGRRPVRLGSTGFAKPRFRASLSPIVFTLAEPRVGHDGFMTF